MLEEAHVQQLEVIDEEVIIDDAIAMEKTCKEMGLSADEGDGLYQIKQFMDRRESCDGIAFKRVERKN